MCVDEDTAYCGYIPCHGVRAVFTRMSDGFFYVKKIRMHVCGRGFGFCFLCQEGTLTVCCVWI